MEEIIKSFFSGLTKSIADGIKQGLEDSDVSKPAPVVAEPEKEKTTKKKKKRKRRTKAEMEAERAKADSDDSDEAESTTDASDDDTLDDVDGEEMDYDTFMDNVRGVLREAAKKGEGEGAKAKKKALNWLSENKGVTQFKDLDASDYDEVLKGITNVVA